MNFVITAQRNIKNMVKYIVIFVKDGNDYL